MAAGKKIGIRGKFVMLLGILGFIALIVIAIASYLFSVKHALSEAKTRGELIVNYILSSRQYYHQSQRPLINEILEKDRFYPELMSEFVIAGETWEIFKNNLPGYEFKQAALNPLQPDNQANTDESGIIDLFRKDPATTEKEGILKLQGEDYYYLAKPLKVNDEGCLDCHGDPADAPKDQVELYGAEGGYNWQFGEVVGADFVYIPINQAMASVKLNAAKILLAGGCVLILSLLFVWVFFNNRIVAPLLRLIARTEEISLGRNLEQELELKDAKDEIGTLAQAIDRLRVSMYKMLTRR
ncbi:DUF3365 domain-containing protein [Thermodesulfobacteriota bacterium]